MTSMGHNGGPPIDDDFNYARYGGWVRVARDVRHHAIVGFGFRVTPADPVRKLCYSRGEAWLDLIMECRYRDGKVLNAGREMHINVGQLVGAVSWLGYRWNWTPKTVQIFLKTLVSAGMIETHAPGVDYVQGKHEGEHEGEHKGKQEGKQKGKQAQVLFICNYADFQRLAIHKGQAEGKAKGLHEGKHEGEQRGNILRNINSDSKTEKDSEESHGLAARAAATDPLVSNGISSEEDASALSVGYLQPAADGDRHDEEFMPMSALAEQSSADADVSPAPQPVPVVAARVDHQVRPVALTPVEIVEVIPPRQASSNDVLVAFNQYNDMAQRIGLPIARSLTPARRRALEARLREHGGLPAWAQILANVERSAFLRGMGGGRAGWRADFDFLIQAKSCAKVFDGGYGNGAHAASSGETAIERTVRLCEEAADRLGISKGGLL